jgi:hypothetical protein
MFAWTLLFIDEQEYLATLKDKRESYILGRLGLEAGPSAIPSGGKGPNEAARAGRKIKKYRKYD